MFEVGRWQNILREDRICRLCNENIGDENHYLFVCKSTEISNLRTKFIPAYYIKYPNYEKLASLLQYCNIRIYKNISLYIMKIMKLL